MKQYHHGYVVAGNIERPVGMYGSSITLAVVVSAIVGWLRARLFCAALSFPSGCHPSSAFEVYRDLKTLSEMSVVACWLVGWTRPPSWRKAVGFLGIFFAFPVVFGGIGEISAMKTSLSGVSLGANAPTAVFGAVFVVIAAFFGRSVWRRRRDRLRCLSYTSSRAAVWSFYTASAVILRLSGYHLHVHHLYVGFLVAIVAGADRDGELSWPDVVCFAVGMSVLVEGVGVYNFATIVQD